MTEKKFVTHTIEVYNLGFAIWNCQNLLRQRYKNDDRQFCDSLRDVNLYLLGIGSVWNVCNSSCCCVSYREVYFSRLKTRYYVYLSRYKRLYLSFLEGSLPYLSLPYGSFWYINMF